MACHDILIIEDEAGIRDTFKDLLEMEGFNVFTAENGREGLRMLQEIGDPCLILLDLMMPIMNGWEFLEMLKNNHKSLMASVPITVISAASDVAAIQENYGCQVLRKPLGIDRLAALAHEHCQPC